MIKILAISGSLRLASSNTTLLRVFSALAPKDVEIILYNGLGDLPHFNPDLSIQPHSVLEFRAQLCSCDGILIASPEYAHGVTGVLKNALDWVVGSEEFINKPIALLNASTRATHAYIALTEIIRTMSAHIITEASVTIPLTPGKPLDEEQIKAHPELSAKICHTIQAFSAAIRSNRT